MRLETLILAGCCGSYPEEAVARVEEALSPICVDETVIMLESPPPGGRAAYELLSFASEISKRVAVLAPRQLFPEAARLAAALSSPNVEVVAVLGRSDADLDDVAATVATAYDRGVDHIAVYLSYEYAAAAEGVSERIEKAAGVAVPVRIGPRPYTGHSRLPDRLRAVLYSIGLPFGLLYGLRARRAVTQHGLRVTLLEAPCPRRCRRLSISPRGAAKCPLRGGDAVPLVELTPERLEEIASAPCSGQGVEERPEIRVKVSIEVSGVEIPADLLELLAAVRMTKSLRGACKALGYDPVNMIAKLRRVERRLGRRLVKGYRGGAGGGYTVLTDLGERIVKKYLRAWARLEG